MSWIYSERIKEGKDWRKNKTATSIQCDMHKNCTCCSLKWVIWQEHMKHTHAYFIHIYEHMNITKRWSKKRVKYFKKGLSLWIYIIPMSAINEWFIMILALNWSAREKGTLNYKNIFICSLAPTILDSYLIYYI